MPTSSPTLRGSTENRPTNVTAAQLKARVAEVRHQLRPATASILTEIPDLESRLIRLRVETVLATATPTFAVLEFLAKRYRTPPHSQADENATATSPNRHRARPWKVVPAHPAGPTTRPSLIESDQGGDLTGTVS